MLPAKMLCVEIIQHPIRDGAAAKGLRSLQMKIYFASTKPEWGHTEWALIGRRHALLVVSVIALKRSTLLEVLSEHQKEFVNTQ